MEALERRLKEIEENTNRIAKKEEQIKELSFEKKLIQEDLIQKVKYLENAFEIRFTAYKEKKFNSAWCYYYSKNIELKNDYEDIKKLLEYIFFDSNEDYFKLTKILVFGFGWAYDFYYQYEGDKEIMIRIPMFNKANEDNLYYLLQGYSLYKVVSETRYDQIISSFNVKEIKEKINSLRKE